MPVLLISRLPGRDNVILISVHANAAGRGDRWYDATKFHLPGLAFYAISNSDGKIGTRLNRL